MTEGERAQERMHVSHIYNYRFTFLLPNSFPLPEQSKKSLTQFHMDDCDTFSLNLLSTPVYGQLRAWKNCVWFVVLKTQYMLAMLCMCASVCVHGGLPVAVGLNWRQTTYIFSLSSFLTFLFTETSINLIAHLIVHLCFHQFQIDYLDCFFHLINVFFIPFGMHTTTTGLNISKMYECEKKLSIHQKKENFFGQFCLEVLFLDIV